MAARSKDTPAVQRAIMTAISNGANYKDAAMAAGISYQTFNEWRNDKPAFADALKAAEARGIVRRLARIERAGKSGAWQADMRFLESRRPDEWVRRERVDQHVSGTVDIRATIRQVQQVLDALLPGEPEVRRLFAAKLMELDASVTAHETESEVE